MGAFLHLPRALHAEAVFDVGDEEGQGFVLAVGSAHSVARLTNELARLAGHVAESGVGAVAIGGAWLRHRPAEGARARVIAVHPGGARLEEPMDGGSGVAASAALHLVVLAQAI